MDEQGNETFVTSGALDKLRKVSSNFDLSNAMPFTWKWQHARMHKAIVVTVVRKKWKFHTCLETRMTTVAQNRK